MNASTRINDGVLFSLANRNESPIAAVAVRFPNKMYAGPYIVRNPMTIGPTSVMIETTVIRKTRITYAANVTSLPAARLKPRSQAGSCPSQHGSAATRVQAYVNMLTAMASNTPIEIESASATICPGEMSGVWLPLEMMDRQICGPFATTITT